MASDPPSAPVSDEPAGASAAHDAAYAEPADAVARALGVAPSSGLPDDEAARRAAAGGPNALERVGTRPVWSMVLESATEPFVLLLAAAGVAAVLLGEVRDGLLILIGLLPIVGADVVTEFRGERALEALREAAAPRAAVRRSGRVTDVPAVELVPGDVVLLRTGDVIPADLRLTRADRLAIDRSVLTGESVPELAAVAADPPGAPLADRRSMAYSGTSVVAGRGDGIVVAIGGATEVGRIAGGLTERRRRRSPLQRELDRLVRMLLFVAIGLIAITSGLGFVRGNPLGENVLAGISAAIAAIPEEPPVLLAVILGLGAYRLLRRGVLVRRLNAEEVLGAVDLVVTDKTGTLTRNQLEVASVGDAAGEIDDPAARRAVLEDALRAEDDAWPDPGDPADGGARGAFTQSIARAIEAAGGSTTLDPAELVAAQPFGSDRPYTSTVSTRDGRLQGLAVGAPEAILALALGGAGRDAERAAWTERVEAAARRGERLIAVAGRWEDAPWSLRGLIGFADTLRPGSVEATRAALEAGVQVVVVTGDHPLTAAAIARQAGLPGTTVALGPELDAIDDDELARRLPGLHVIARSTPDLKRRVVEVARRAGRLVAVTGDGVNDAPALHAADVAVAMGSGTAVAREASDLVLGDDSFASLVFGMDEGRRIVDNVQKGLVFLVSTHVALLGFILIATLAGFSQPLLPIQILWLELFIDLAASVAFEREPPEPGLMSRPPRPVSRPLLTAGILGRISVAGAFSAVAALAIMVLDPAGTAHGQWLAYTTLVCAQAVRAYSNRSLTVPLRRLGRNGFLLAACLTVVVIQVVIPLVPPLADAFRAVELTPVEWVLVAIIALAPAALAELIRSRGRTSWVA